jgi:hypothetical protein
VRKSSIVAAVFVGSALAPGVALAHGGGGSMPTETPVPPPGEGLTALNIVRELEAKGATAQETARVTAEPIKAVKLALERARGARVAGDEAHARMLDGIALEWAETARDLDRAATVERAATAEGQRALEAQTKADRARALLEETQARRGRTAAELARVEAEAKDATKGAADAEQRRLEAAKQKKAPPPAPKKGAK